MNAKSPTTSWIYDIEIYPNMFEVSFIPYGIPQDVINLYIAADIAKNVQDKKAILDAIGAKTFIIFRAWHEDKYERQNFTPTSWDDSNNISSGIEGLYMFFKTHKIIIGYNSFNYDMTMLDIFIHYAPTFDWKTGLREDVHGIKEHITEFMFEHSQKAVDRDMGGKTYRRLLDFYKGRRYFRPFTDFDIQKILYLDATFVALKAVMIVLKWYRIQDLPIHWSYRIKREEIELVTDYNINDVLGTDALVKNQQKELDLRAKLSEMYGIDLRNMSRSSIGKNLMTKFYSEWSGMPSYEFVDLRTERSAVPIKKIVKDSITFKTPFYRAILDNIQRYSIFIGIGAAKQSELRKENIGDITITTWKKSFQSLEFLSHDKGYTMAKGGLHSKDDPKVIWAEPNEILADPDVNSMYPSFIVEYGVSPHHLSSKVFLGIVEWLRTTRLDAKHNGRKLEADALKIVINRIYGALNDAMDYLYDPECTYTVTINLQLLLCNLIEAFELNKFEVLSANTDGLLIRLPIDRKGTFDHICKEWEEYSKLTLETEKFEKYCRSAVNDYIAVGYGFYDALQSYNRSGSWIDNKGNVYTSKAAIENKFIKYKGYFLQEPEYNKGYEYPVVKKALKEYFLYGVDITEFIKNYINTSKTAIYDYCFSQKVASKYTTIYKTIKDGKPVWLKCQKHNRFYICKSGGGAITKAIVQNSDNIAYGEDISDCVITDEKALVAGQKVALFNEYEYKDDYNIHLGFYINEANKILYGNGKTGKGERRGINNNSSNLFGW